MKQLTANSMFHQWLVGFGVSLLLLQIGFLIGWTSPSLARLTAPDSQLPLSLDQASWIASLLSAGLFIGTIVGLVLSSNVGRKRTTHAALCPLAIGWLSIIIADRVEWLYISRLSLGAGMGMAYTSFQMYIGEVSIPEIRGALIAVAFVGSAFGNVISSICGIYLSLSQAASIYLGLAVLLMVFFFWLPETPHYFIQVGNREAAQESIHWYRNGQEVNKELEAVENLVGNSSTESFMQKLLEFKSRPVKRATYQMLILFFFMQICGLNAVTFYMETILKDAKFNLFDPAFVVVLANGFSIVGSVISFFLIDKCGRKFLMVVSSLGVCLSMLLLFVHFFSLETGRYILEIESLPMVSMFMYMVSYYEGLICVPNTILGEIFPTNIKSLAGCLSVLTVSVVSFIVSKSYQPMVDNMGQSWVFLTYALISAAATPYTIFFMKETKGKTLSEIQDELKVN